MLRVRKCLIGEIEEAMVFDYNGKMRVLFDEIFECKN
jgi:hypothetical protein